MDLQAIRPRVPLPVAILSTVAVVVILALLAQTAVGIFVGIVQTIIIFIGFAAIAVVGLWLWRRGGD